jgi:TM2 domain-containing membrane protein YozV
MPNDTNTPTEPNWTFAIIATGLAWLIPGAGHIYAGRTVRGIILLIVLGATFWAGIAFGGVMTVDSRNERLWFYAQSLTGVHGMVSWYRQEQVYREIATEYEIPLDQIQPSPRPGAVEMEIDYALQQKKLASTEPAAGIARTYTGIAGLLNLLCIFDILMLCLMGQGKEPKPAEVTP